MPVQITLSESGRKVDLRSPKVKKLQEIESAQMRMLSGEMDLQDFRMMVLDETYPELKTEVQEWAAADLTQLVNSVLRYAQGGPDAIKNSCPSGTGTQTRKVEQPSAETA